MTEKIILDLEWRHAFHGSYYSSVFTVLPTGYSSQADEIGKWTKLEYRKKVLNDGKTAVIWQLNQDGSDQLAEKLSEIRMPKDRCSQCGLLHEIGDLAHSVDWATTAHLEWTVRPVDHPGQLMLF